MTQMCIECLPLGKKAIRRIWNLPTHFHRVLLCGLNEGNHVYDYVFKRFIKMYNSMKCKNTKSGISRSSC